MVFTSATLAANEPQTGFETGSSAEFINYTNRSSLSEMNNTASGTYSQLLHGGYSSQVGAATTLHVYPGDTIKAQVYAKYRSATGTASNLTGFAAALTTAFGVSSGSVGEALNAYTGLNSYGTMLAAGDREDDDDTDPKGFITIMLFDKHHNFLDAAWDQMDDYEQTSTPPAKDPFDLLFKQMVVREEGYAYIFVSNENPTKVDIHFDDLKVTHAKSQVIQYNEYYPFGLQTSTSWTRENAKDNNYLYNAANELNKTSGWYEMYYRGYDPAIARMLQVDPYATMFASFTTYNYAINNPVMMNDPSGGQSETDSHTYGISAMGMNRYDAIQSMSAVGDYFANWDQSFFQRSGGNLSNPAGPFKDFWNAIQSKMKDFEYDADGSITLSRDRYGNWTKLVPYNYSTGIIPDGANLKEVVTSYRRVPMKMGYVQTQEKDTDGPEFGILSGIGAALYYLGMPLDALKPGAPLGSEVGSSWLSKKLSERFPKPSPSLSKFQYKLYKKTATVLGPQGAKLTVGGTGNIVGRIVGRWASTAFTGVGIALIAYDVFSVVYPAAKSGIGSYNEAYPIDKPGNLIYHVR